MSNEWKQNDPETAKCMVNFLLDELQPQLWTKKKDAIATFTSYYFRSFPIYDDSQIRNIFLGDSSRRGLLQACGQISWKSFKIKTSSVRSLDLLVDLLDDAKNRESSAFIRVFLSLDDASFRQMRLDKLLHLRETKAKATTVMNLLQSNGRQVPISEDEFVDGAAANLGHPAGDRDRQISSRHRDSIMVPTPQAAVYIPAPSGGRSQLTTLMAKLSSLLSRRPNFSSLVEKGIVQAPKAFGRPLEEVVSRSNVDGVPVFLAQCCDNLRKNAFDKVGLFRVSGEQAEVFRLKRMIDYENEFSLENISPHSVAGLIKLWVRELPEPLLTFGLYDQMVKCTREENWSELDRLEASLPATNLRIFQYLCSFLAEVSQKADFNKMTPSNLAIVFAPNLIRPIIETFEAIARDTPVTIATIRYFIEKASKAKTLLTGDQTTTTINEPTSAIDTPLPENWTVYLDETTGTPFYYNSVTTESRWDRPTNTATIPEPSSEHPASKTPNPPSPARSATVLPPGWVEFCDEKTGVPYYYNEATDECSWVRPAGSIIAEEPPKDPFESVKFTDLQHFSVVTGKWNKDSAGGTFPEMTWFRNPQWLVHLPDSGPATLRVNMATTAKAPMGVHIITVSISRTAEHGRLLTIQSEDQIVLIGPFQESDNSISQSAVEASVTGPCSFMVVPATNIPDVFADFKISVSCDHPISMTGILDAGVWHKIVAHSDWSESTSGGCYPNFASWRNNNQFKMAAEDVSHPIRVLIHLQRHQNDPDFGAIGIYVLANSGPAEEKLGVSDGDVLARSEFVTSNETVVELVVPTNAWSSTSEAGVKHVVVVPCTYEPGVIDSFTLTVYADHNVSLSLISNRWSATPVLSSRWTTQNSGGCRNYETWQKNPNFTLSAPPAASQSDPSSWSAMCILSQPDPEHILPIGFYVTDTNGRTRCKGTFSLAPEVFGQMTFRREESPYTFYACTFNPALVGDFNVQVFSEQPCTLEPITPSSRR